MPAYPAPFDHGRFPAIPDPVPPKERQTESKRSASVTTQHGGTLRPKGKTSAAVKQVWIQAVGDQGRRSQSFQNLTLDDNEAIKTDPHFNFLPGIDQVEIRWEVRAVEDARKVRFELWSVLENTRPVWTKEYRDAEAVRVLRGTGDDTGPLAWSEVAIDGDAPRFPDRCPNVAGAPYQLRLIVTSKSTSAVTTAWSYFDVLVHSIELHWGDAAMIPAEAIGGVLSDPWRTLTQRDEPALLNGLRQPGGVVNTAIPDSGEIPLPLRSTNASYTYFHEWSKGRDFGFLRHKLRWGVGPRLPILAKLFLRKMDGDGLHSDPAAKALGPAEFLWSWRDRTMDERDAAEHAGFQQEVVDFIKAALRFQESTPNEPPGCLNCHALRGGKRGGTVRVLRETDGTGNFPFEGRAASTRKWATLTKAHTAGAHAGWTGVLFQPSRMALDSYKVRVFLATPASLPTLDVATGRSRRLVRGHPGLPTATTGVMVVKRRIDARYIRKSNATPAMNLGTFDACFAVGGLQILWQNQLWNRAQFLQCFNAALAPDNAGEALGWARNSIYGKTAALRRRGIVNGAPQRLPLTIARLAQYDQWSGEPVATATAADPPNEANFTVPGRDLIDRPIIASAVRSFVANAANNAAGRWNTFLGNHGGLAPGEAEVLFYQNGLNQAERDLVHPEILRLYNDPTNQLRDFDAPANQAVKWIEANYSYIQVGLMKIVAEMHVRKLMADAFEGVTFFHYTHFLEPKTATGGVMGRQVGIGGFAGIELSRDLGLDAAFLAWGRATDTSRRDLKRQLAQFNNDPVGMACEMKNGEITAAHEFGHFLHLPHRDGGGADGVVNAAHYLGADPNHRCLMDYDPNGNFLCGVCALRIRGWAWRQETNMQGLGNDLTNVAQGVASDAPDADTTNSFNAVYSASPLA